LKNKWKKPRGTGNKQRQKLKQTWPIPSTGYSRDKSERYKHPSGLKEVLVSTVKALAPLKDVAVRISSKVGLKKRIEIEKEAEKKGLKILNKNSNVKLSKLEKLRAEKRVQRKEKVKKAKEKAKAEKESKQESEQEKPKEEVKEKPEPKKQETSESKPKKAEEKPKEKKPEVKEKPKEEVKEKPEPKND
jgi:large subunit ribosomal protein L32e